MNRHRVNSDPANDREHRKIYGAPPYANQFLRGWLRPWLRLGAMLLLGIWAVWGQALPAAAQGNVIDVTTTSPVVADDGQCSLAEAIDNANANGTVHTDCAPGAGDDIIRLASEEVYTFTFLNSTADGPNALPLITSDITIEGNDATLVRGDGLGVEQFRFFHVGPTATLTLEEITLANGNALAGGTLLIPFPGGAIFNRGNLIIRDSILEENQGLEGGAIASLPNATLRIENSTLRNNISVEFGGAIATRGATTIRNSTFSGNESGGTGGAIDVSADAAHTTVEISGSEISDNVAVNGGGGGIAASSTLSYTLWLTVSESSILSNTVQLADPQLGMGGGIFATIPFTPSQSNTLHAAIIDSTLRGNRARNGGGIAGTAPATSLDATLHITVSRSLIAENEADGTAAQSGNGGGIFNVNGEVLIVNSTLSGNEASGSGPSLSGQGGAIANVGIERDTSVEIINSSLVSNTASLAGGAITNLRAILPTVASVEIENTILAFNSATLPNSNTCFTDTPGSIESRGYNLESINSCGFTQPTDILNTDPRIGPLADNGGPTFTHALLPGSPAISRANRATCEAEPVARLDQRRTVRHGSTCDIGAYEFQTGVKLFPTIVVNALGGTPEEEEV